MVQATHCHAFYACMPCKAARIKGQLMLHLPKFMESGSRGGKSSQNRSDVQSNQRMFHDKKFPIKGHPWANSFRRLSSLAWAEEEDALSLPLAFFWMINLCEGLTRIICPKARRRKVLDCPKPYNLEEESRYDKPNFIWPECTKKYRF